MNDAKKHYDCAGIGIRISATTTPCASDEVDAVIEKLDTQRGVMLTSRYEYPGRYTRWDIGLVNPPLVMESTGDVITVSALNERGQILLPAFLELLSTCEFVDVTNSSNHQILCTVIHSGEIFMEEDRSKMPHVMNVVRHLRDGLAIDDARAGFYGIFGYDLGIDFMGVKRVHERNAERDLVLYFADQLFVTDHENDVSYRVDYEFEISEGENRSTLGMERSGVQRPYQSSHIPSSRDMEPGEYSDIVVHAKEYFARGDLFEVVPSQSFHEPCAASPATVFNQLLDMNPAPYGALINLGENEWTVSASPEMFVRVDGQRIESCPIAGTIARGTDAATDAIQIAELLGSEKEESELTMCTDVDRNDKSRVCKPETINVIGRRQIEMYSRLIHTVDHVEGYLQDGYDSIDAFLTHMWAVTVTGAPKMWAMNFIENYEKSPRRFYGGSMGFVGLDGSMNTGLMLRSVHFSGGSAHIRVGATLLADSDPVAEERETELKASAMLDVVRYCNAVATGQQPDVKIVPASNEVVITDKNENVADVSISHSISSTPDDENKPNVLLIDCEDSFVHTLAGYFRMCGAVVHTRRVGFTPEEFETDLTELSPDLIVLSPGPGSPTDFGLSAIIEKSRAAHLPIFGVCLGLQALVEYFGGNLSQLDEPVHGKVSEIFLEENSGFLFNDIASPFEAGRYHSLFANPDSFPDDQLRITARTHDGVIMAIEHVNEPIAAVQFHPESIMTLRGNTGQKIVQNALSNLARRKGE